MSTLTNAVKAGDKVIYLKNYGEDPQIIQVESVTPKGWLRTSFGTYRPNPWNGEYATSNSRSTVFPFTQEKFDKLQAEYERIKKAQAEQKTEQERRKAERQATYESQLSEIKRVMEGTV